MNKRSLFACLALICVALTCVRPAMGITVFTSTNLDLEITNPVSVGDGSENLVGFMLTAVGKNGFLPSGWDGSVTGNLHQQSFPGNFGGPTPPTATRDTLNSATVATEGIDTHFAFPLADVGAATVNPTEASITSLSAEATDATGPNSEFTITGFGTSLSGQFSLGSPVANQDWAYIVVPDGSTVGLSMSIGSGVSGGELPAVVIDDSFVASAVPEIPEPSSIALLSIALLSLVGYGRRRS